MRACIHYNNNYDCVNTSVRVSILCAYFSVTSTSTTVYSYNWICFSPMNFTFHRSTSRHSLFANQKSIQVSLLFFLTFSLHSVLQAGSLSSYLASPLDVVLASFPISVHTVRFSVWFMVALIMIPREAGA